MRLFEIKQLNEGLVPIHLTMILREIIAAGKATNTVHFVILAQLIEFFKYCSATAIHNYNEHPSNKELLDSIKELSDKDQTGLATWLLERFEAGELEAEQCAQWACPQMTLNQWVGWVLRKQD
jgi:hypothetical protein